MRQLQFLLICLFVFPTLFTSQSPNKALTQPQVDSLLAQGHLGEACIALQQMLLADRTMRDTVTFPDHVSKLAEAYFDQKKWEQGEQVTYTSLAWMDSMGRGSQLGCGKIWWWRALHLLKLERYTEALDSYTQAIKIYEKSRFNGPELAFCYKNAAQIYIRWSNYTEATSFLESAISSDTTEKYLLPIYTQLANNFYWQDSLIKALRYFHLGEILLPSGSPGKQASLQSVGSNILSKIGQSSEARKMAVSALAYYQNDSNQVENTLRTLTTLAEIDARSGREKQAEAFLEKAIRTGQGYFKHKSREMARLYVETGLFYEKTKQPDRALAFYQQALVQAFPNFNSLDSDDNPSLADARLEAQAMRAAAAKARVLLTARKPTTADRLNAAHCFDLAFSVAAHLRRTYGYDADKYALAADNRTVLVVAVQNLWQLYQQRQDPVHLTHLFNLLERTRATALADALQQQRALVLAGIPDSLLAHEQNLRLEVASTAKILKDKELEGKVNEVEVLKALLFRQQKTYDDLLADLQIHYPQFAQYTQADQIADLPTIQSTLSDTTALLSWFDAGDRYLCLVVRHGSISAFETLRDSTLDQKLTGLVTLLSDKTAQETSPANYFAAAHQLGQQLLPADLLATTKSLIVIPDGPLCYLPFEALLTAAHTGNFAAAPYLLRSHTVQYAWSATLLTMTKDGQKSDNQGFLQIVPFAKTARNGLAPLPNSPHDKPEHLAALVLSGEQASAAAFLQNASSYNILHLSTHANAGGEGEAGIEFFDRTLTLPEVYAQRFHASLVSLSACETGTGQFATGEGVLSLARAFAYAGAQSLVASHWAVNERSTAQLFSAFYENLAKGSSKSAALRQAKLTYLSSNEMDARKAPYQWAAFTLTGADGPVEFGHPWGQHWLLWAGGLGLAVLGFWFLGKRKRVDKKSSTRG